MLITSLTDGPLRMAVGLILMILIDIGISTLIVGGVIPWIADPGLCAWKKEAEQQLNLGLCFPAVGLM